MLFQNCYQNCKLNRTRGYDPKQLPVCGKVSRMEPGLIFVGTHRRAHRADPVDVAFGIYAFRSGRGGLIALGMTATPQPGWITMHPGGRFLYAANEVGTFEGTAGGGVSAFAVDLKSGAL